MNATMRTPVSVNTVKVKTSPSSKLRRCLRRKSCFLIGAISVNLIVLYFLAVSQHRLDGHVRILKNPFDLEVQAEAERREEEMIYQKEVDLENDLEHAITVVIYDFEDFENEIEKTVSGIRKVLPNVQIVIVSDHLPYPPINLPECRHIHLVVTAPSLDKPNRLSKPEHYIKTKYSVIIPDATVISSIEVLRNMAYLLERQSDSNKIIAGKVVPSSEKKATILCLKTEMNIKKWTLKHTAIKGSQCDGVLGATVLMLNSAHLLSLPEPFARPMHFGFFTQTHLKGMHVHLSDDFKFTVVRDLYEDPHTHWKRKTHEHTRLKEFSSRFGIKLYKQATGQDQWLGCDRDTRRCFGTVIEEMPEYIYHGRWTPPCCLRHLRATARHVFNTLQSQDVRYWLEGGTLLGAARNGDIIPWDYDIDIGIYRDDIERSDQLTKCQLQPYQDSNGYIWERAKEGDFYRVQFSATNHLHVDIYPFVSRNGTMTKRTWMKSHKQDREFPEHFLKPLTTMQFVGVEASVPNNVKDFLELKFGKGVIENPQYPNPSKIKDIPSP